MAAAWRAIANTTQQEDGNKHGGNTREKKGWMEEKEQMLKAYDDRAAELRIKERQMDDATDTIQRLKEQCKREEERRKDAEDRAERRASYKHDLRAVEAERDEIQQELEIVDGKRHAEKESFAAIRGHLEAIVEEQVRVFLFFCFSVFCFCFDSAAALRRGSLFQPIACV